MSVIISLIMIYLHFHIFSWVLNDGCFEGVVHYFRDMQGGSIIVGIWLLSTTVVFNYLFDLNPITTNIILIIPYYFILKWAVSKGVFDPNPWTD